MKIKLTDIPEEGLTLSERVDAGALKLQTDGLRFTAPLAVTAHFNKQRDAVLVGVGVKGDLELVCSRCGESFGKPYHGQFRLNYSAKEQNMLDVSDDVRQEIFLTYPVKCLCREDCRGLCPVCGKNLNMGECPCSSSRKRGL